MMLISRAGSIFNMLAIGLCLVPLGSCGQESGNRADRPELRHVQICKDVQANARGTTTVPTIKYGTSVDDAVAILARAGLCGEPPTVDFPHYVTATYPSAGSVVERGTHVTFMIGDG